MTVLVDEVNREHRVCVLRDAKRIALRRIDLDGFESIAELRARAVKSLARAGTVLGEAKAENGHVATLGDGEVFV